MDSSDDGAPRQRSGPLAGLRVVEFAGIGPAPFAAMLLSDMGADVLRIDREGPEPEFVDVTRRGRRSLVLDLKQPDAAATCLDLIEKADLLIEGFRPGVMERLGLGPEPALARNPRLIYGRMTGWGQTGPLSGAAGHDITYIALSGALAALARDDAPPAPPLNLVGDYGGGALYLCFGLLAALYERERSGFGQVVDAAVLDGAASMMSLFCGDLVPQAPQLGAAKILSGRAPNYRCYRCADGKFLAVGPIEPEFHRTLAQALGLDADEPCPTGAPETWPDLSARYEALFSTRTRAEWCSLLESTDACVAPVLDLAEAPDHPHNAARGVFSREGGLTQPAPAPRLSRTPGRVQGPPVRPGDGGEEALRDWGVQRPRAP